MDIEEYPDEFIKLLHSIEAKRPKTVIEHILEHGQITTEELKDVYGYNHPPRAIRDVREQGIPLITFRVLGNDGRRIAAYKFGDPFEVRSTQLSGRTAFSSKLKSRLIDLYGFRCNIYLEVFPERDLQIDHRIPFEIFGEGESLSETPDEYMLLSASANRAKSWSCEHCNNWKIRNIDNCKTCYWAYPENYTHVSMREIRRLDIIWSGEEISEFDSLKTAAQKAQEEMPDFVKNVLKTHLIKR